MGSSKSDEILRFFKCYVQTVTDVIIDVSEEKLLQPKRWTLQQFLEDKKHSFYHQVGTFYTPSCACSAIGCLMSKKIHKIDQHVFESLYDVTGNKEPGHETRQRGKVDQICIHKYVPKNITLDNLDISTLCFMLTTTGSLNSSEMSCVKKIRDYRNDVCHIWTKNHYTTYVINKMWTELESSLMSLTCKRHIQRMIKTEFKHHRSYAIGSDETSELLEKMEKMIEDVNQLPSKADFDSFKHDCLHQRNAITDIVCAQLDKQSSDFQNKLSEGFKTIQEIQQNSTEIILQAIGNANFEMKYPRLNLIPQSNIKLRGEGKVLWQIETPANWDVEGVEATLMDKSKSEELPLKVKFVKTGSLYLLTSVPASILENPATFESAIKTFLTKMVDICKFDTSTTCHVEIVLSFLQEHSDSIEIGGEESVSYLNQAKPAEFETKTSISSQTDLIVVECPHCYNTIEFDNDVFAAEEKVQVLETKKEGNISPDNGSVAVPFCKLVEPSTIDRRSRHLSDLLPLTFQRWRSRDPQGHVKKFASPAKMASFFDKNIQLNCEEHKQRYQYYCRSHDRVICQKCRLESHKKCKDTLDIEDVIHKVKSSAVFEDLWTNIKTNHQALLNAIIDREENVKKLQKKKEKLSTEVKKRTQNLIDQIKKLENKTLSELESVVNENINEIKATTKILESNKRKLGELLEQEELIKNHVSNFQTFIATKQMEREVQESEEILHKLSEKGAMDNTDIEMNENITADDTIFGIKTLCDIKVSKEKNTTSIDINKPSIGQAEVKTRFPRQLTLKQQFTARQGWCFGCCRLPNGLLVLTDCYNGVVNILHSNGQHKSSVRFNGGRDAVYDVTVINENHVAVSNPLHKTISIIDVDRSKIIKTLQIKSPVRGITHSDGHLYFCVPQVGIRKINIDTEKIDKLHDDRTVDVKSYIDTDGNRICYTCPYNYWNNGTVAVLDSDLRVIFTFKDHNTMSLPHGLSMDEHQNIFVCNNYNNNLLLISRDGDKHEVVVSGDDGLYLPVCVHYDKVTHLLTVVDEKVIRIFTVY